MKSCILLASVIITIFFMGCKKQHGPDNVITHIDGKLREVKCLSLIFKLPRIIQLETINESLIGRNINKIKKKNGEYFISFDNKSLVIFDQQGKFLRRIQKKGRAPGEYISLVDFDVLPSGNIVILDVKKLILYSNTGEFLKAIPLDIFCYNLKAVDEEHFLIRASGEKYILYLIDSKGYVVEKQLKREGIPVWGESVAFYTLGNNSIFYQQDCSNDFIFFNTGTKEFTRMNLVSHEERCDILSIETVNKHRKKYEEFNSLEYVEHNPGLKMIRGVSSYTDYLFFALGSHGVGFKCYLMNTNTNKIEYLLTENTVNDISFTNTFSLLGTAALSDSEDCFITYVYPYQIVDGLNESSGANEQTNYRYLQSLFKDIQDVQNENPVLIELKI